MSKEYQLKAGVLFKKMNIASSKGSQIGSDQKLFKSIGIDLNSKKISKIPKAKVKKENDDYNFIKNS